MKCIAQVGLRIMLIPISTTVTQQASFRCNLGSALSQFEVCLRSCLGLHEFSC